MPESNGRQHEARPDAPPGVNEPPDPLAEAEALRALLGEALSRTSRLVACLKQHRRQSRAVQAAVASLRRLRQFEG